MLFYTLMMLYALAFCAVCRRCHQLKAIYYFMLSAMIATVSFLLYDWESQAVILMLLIEATSAIMILEWSMIGLGVVYQFGYLRTKIENHTQRKMLLSCPTYALIMPFLLNVSMKEKHHEFWQKYHKHRNDVSFPY